MKKSKPKTRKLRGRRGMSPRRNRGFVRARVTIIDDKGDDVISTLCRFRYSNDRKRILLNQDFMVTFEADQPTFTWVATRTDLLEPIEGSVTTPGEPTKVHCEDRLRFDKGQIELNIASVNGKVT